MAIELPAEQKVYTTSYDNFKGVDFSNDATNVWRRRSPSGVNMLPDASGRPFKRYGWERAISNKDLLVILNNKLAEEGKVEITVEASTGDDVKVDTEVLLSSFGDGEYEFVWSAKYEVVTEDEVEASEDAFGDYFNWDEGYYTFTLGDGWSYEFEPTGEAEASSGEIDLSEIGVALLRDFEVGESFMVEITVDWDNESWEFDRQPTDIALYGLYPEGEFEEDDTITVTVSGCETEIAISKCCWFEISGLPHTVVFTDKMAFFYYIENGAGKVSSVSTDEDLYNSYDKAFFFEGNGKSAFYIYGNNKVWEYLDDLALHRAEPTIPNVISGADATSVGTIIQGFNLLGSLAWIGYNSNSCKTTWGSEGLLYSVDYDKFSDGRYAYEYTEGAWTPTPPTDGITVSGGLEEGAKIVVVKGNFIVLPNNVSQMQTDELEVYASAGTQFDTKYDVITTGTPVSGECLYIQDEELNKHACLKFAEALAEIVQGEDFIKVVFPSRSVLYTVYEDETAITQTGQASLKWGG